MFFSKIRSESDAPKIVKRRALSSLLKILIGGHLQQGSINDNNWKNSSLPSAFAY